MIVSVSIKVNENVFIKDPKTSDLGQRIVSAAIDMIVDLGFESFTFKKLAREIASTEASIYRYFESKNMLLLYLTSWYWEWMRYRLSMALTNIDDPKERLLRAVQLLTDEVTEDGQFTHIDEVKLAEIINNESAKVYMNKSVDDTNSTGVFLPYKQLVQEVSDIVLEINQEFKYPHMLISTVVEGCHHQRFFADHLPRLTDTIPGEDAITEFYKTMVFKAIQ
jgi:AcrR family transcriptional regulator